MNFLKTYELFLGGDFAERKQRRNKTEREENKSRRKRQNIEGGKSLETSPTKDLNNKPENRQMDKPKEKTELVNSVYELYMGEICYLITENRKMKCQYYMMKNKFKEKYLYQKIYDIEDLCNGVSDNYIFKSLNDDATNGKFFNLPRHSITKHIHKIK